VCPFFRESDKLGAVTGLKAGFGTNHSAQESAMDRLLLLDERQLAGWMQDECRRLAEQVAEAVNAAPTGNVISGSEMQVRDLMDDFRRRTFEAAVQMRIDSTESSFSPSQGRGRQGQGPKGVGCRQDHAKRLRQDRAAAASLRDQGSGQRISGRSPGG
jgi:hypothetical protein